jgi:hypothetical protein
MVPPATGSYALSDAACGAPFLEAGDLRVTMAAHALLDYTLPSTTR